MKSNQSNSAARNSAASNTPSVPISVYRELAAELQATRAMVDSLNTKNQQLDQENYRLRQEMQRVVYSVLTLQPWIGGLPEENHSASPPTQTRPKGQTKNGPTFSERPTWEETTAATAIAAKLRTPTSSQANEWFTEEPATPQQVSQTKPARNLGGLWLTLTIVTIIVTAFGAGFLIMRPFLPTK